SARARARRRHRCAARRRHDGVVRRRGRIHVWGDAGALGSDMNEVASRVLHIWFKPIESKQLTIEDMIAGTNVTPRTLRSKNSRIDWTDFCRIHANMRPHFTDEELVEVGRTYLRSPALRFIFVIARLRFTPMGF